MNKDKIITIEEFIKARKTVREWLDENNLDTLTITTSEAKEIEKEFKISKFSNEIITIEDIKLPLKIDPSLLPKNKVDILQKWMDDKFMKKEDFKRAQITNVKRLREEITPLKRQQKELRDDIIGIKKIVGSETYGEWKVLLSEIDKVNTRIDALTDIKDAYDKVLTQQAEVIKQQSSFMNWIKYSTILLPIAVASIAIIEILIRYFLGVL